MSGRLTGHLNGHLIGFALVSAILWGLWWVPVRLMEAGGLTGIWSAILMNAAALPVLAFIAMRGGGFGGLDRRSLIGASLAGVAVTFYSNALNHADVVRVVVLFYLAPAWSTLIECVFLGRRWSLASLVALGLAFGGLALILGGDIGSGAIGRGEVMAVAAGMAWAAGAALVFMAPEPRPASGALAFSTVGAAVVVGLALAILEGAPPPPTAGAGAYAVAGGAGLVYIAPMMALTLWVATRLPPALLSFLLTAEIISGVSTSAIFLDEPFGLAECAGAILVALAAVVEVRAQQVAGRVAAGQVPGDLR